MSDSLNIDKDIGYRLFVHEIQDAETMMKRPEFFRRSAKELPDPIQGELCILRRWNSHSPSIFNVLGGGYFLRWGNKGTVIDPGCSFIKLFQSMTSYNFGDIDMIIVTHDHVDHCQDLGGLITLFRQYNKLLLNGDKEPKLWSMIVSYGVADEYDSILNHPDNLPFLFWDKVLAQRPTPIQALKLLPKHLRKARQSQLDSTYLYLYRESAKREIPTAFSYTLSALPANHKELLGDQTTFGLKFTLTQGGQKEEKTIVISSDTGIHPDEKINNGAVLAEYYNGADLLILHVGGLEDPAKHVRYDGDHLGLQGVVEILSKIQNKPKLVILTEWGYEFGRLGTKGRTKFTQFVARELRNQLGNTSPYYAAIIEKKDDLPAFPSGIKPDERIPIIPADVALRIGLPNFEIHTNHGFKDFHSVAAMETMERIDYLEI